MQPIIDFWKKSIVNKLIVGGLGILLLCCSCVGVTLMIPNPTTSQPAPNDGLACENLP